MKTVLTLGSLPPSIVAVGFPSRVIRSRLLMITFSWQVPEISSTAGRALPSNFSPSATVFTLASWLPQFTGIRRFFPGEAITSAALTFVEVWAYVATAKDRIVSRLRIGFIISLLVGWMVTPASTALRTGANLSVRTLALGCVMAGPRWSVNPGHISCCALVCIKPYRDGRFMRYGRWASGATLRPPPEAGMPNLRSSHAFLRFGTFDLDRHTGELRRDGARIRMQEQPLQILRILL